MPSWVPLRMSSTQEGLKIKERIYQEALASKAAGNAFTMLVSA
jgi:hypothetical protein